MDYRDVMAGHRFVSSRRALLKGGAAAIFLLGSTSLATPLWAAAGDEFESTPFDFDALSERMRLAASEPHAPDLPGLPEAFANLDYDSYRLIQYRGDRSKWRDAAHDYRLQAFPMGWLYPEPVSVFEIVDGHARPFDFSSADFDYRDADLAQAAKAEPFPGVAGIRVGHPLGDPDIIAEMLSYVGASYFRALGRDNVYGLSARGVAVNTWVNVAEEFPHFSAFYLERPEPGHPLVVYAALEGESLTGAYRFTITPASPEVQETVMDVTARLFFRKDIAELGIAPLTSMFLFAQANRDDFDDYRPQVHDSNGLLVEDASGEVLWRPLSNGGGLGNSYLTQTNPKAFGLYQRDREFEQYQDAGAKYEKRPSARIEPVGEWGQGLVRLVEIPAELEAEDNIVAFWVPQEPARAGGSQEVSYRIVWGDLAPSPDAPLAHVLDTRAGRGGVSGVGGETNLRKFVIDFAGEALDSLPEGASIDLFNSAGGGRIVHATLSHLREHGLWRAVLDVEADGSGPVELKAYLVGSGRVLTETWLYQWRPTA